MSNNKKQKGNRRLLLIGAVLASVFIVGAFGITPIVFKRPKNLKWADWTGFGKTEVITTTKKEDDKTTVSTQTHPGKTFWDWFELLAVPILIAFFGYQFQQIDKKRASEEQARLAREIAQNNLFEEAIQVYVDSMAKLLLDKERRKELFPNVNDKLNPSGCGEHPTFSPA